MTSNDSLRFAFAFDRDYLFDVFQMCQIALPIVNTLTVHPLALIMLRCKSRTMGADIRLGYFLTEAGPDIMFQIERYFLSCLIFMFPIGKVIIRLSRSLVISLIVHDWLFSSFFRMYPILPYSGFYCGGPACRIVKNRSALMCILSISITTNIPCFLYLVLRMQDTTLEVWNMARKITHRRQSLFMLVNIGAVVTNICGFAIFGFDSNNADTIRSDPELGWLADRGGSLLIFGDFGNAQYFKFELYILAASIFVCAPVPTLVIIGSVRNLKSTMKLILLTFYHFYFATSFLVMSEGTIVSIQIAPKI